MIDRNTMKQVGVIVFGGGLNVRRAIDAWADAALMAMRAGRSTVASERVRAITARTRLHPLPD